MSFTKHSNLETIAQGVDNWDAPLNENWDIIDKGSSIKAIAGQTLSAYKVVYRTTDDTLKLSIAGITGSADSRFVGFTKEDFNLGADGFAQYDGWISDPNWSLTPSAPYYLSNSNRGEMTSAKPGADSILVGMAIGTNELLIKPWIETITPSSGTPTDYGDAEVSRAKFKDYAETLTTANTSTTYTIDYESSNVFELTLTGNCTYTFSNPPASGVAGSFTLIQKQDATGNRTVTWPASVKWNDGERIGAPLGAPVGATQANGIAVYTFLTTDAGNVWLGFEAAADMA